VAASEVYGDHQMADVHWRGSSTLEQNTVSILTANDDDSPKHTSQTTKGKSYKVTGRGLIDRVRFPAGLQVCFFHHRFYIGCWGFLAIGNRGLYPRSKVAWTWSWSLTTTPCYIKNVWVPPLQQNFTLLFLHVYRVFYFFFLQIIRPTGHTFTDHSNIYYLTTLLHVVVNNTAEDDRQDRNL